MNLFKVKQVIEGTIIIDYCVAESTNDVEDNYAGFVSVELIHKDVTILEKFVFMSINDLFDKFPRSKPSPTQESEPILSITLPNKDAIITEGYNKAKNQDYKNRNVLRHKEQDDYYSGWMDCYDYISKGFK